MATVDEISFHDVETVEGALDNSYARLGSIAKRMEVYDVQTIHEAQEQLNLEAASSTMFNAIYLLDQDGALYSSSYVRLGADAHSYDEMFADGRDHFVMLYDDANGQLETTKESLIYGIRLDDSVIGGHTFVAMIGRSDLSTIRDQLLIESFDGQGVSSVVNAYGYYIVNAAPVTDLAGRDNFYDMLESGTLENTTVDEVRENITEGKDFVINFVNHEGERLVLSFRPIDGTAWSFIMSVPIAVFDQQFEPFILMTAGMLATVVIVLIIMMALIYRFLKRSVLASAEAAARAEFLSNMSHEIRTPLNGIIGLNHLMERHIEDREAMDGYVRKLGRTAQYLLSLVNDILDVSKLQAGKVELVCEPFDMTALIDNVCEMQRDPIVERDINLKVQAEDVPYPYLVGDEVRISQVLMNILSNAVKFTPAGGSIAFSASQVLDPTGAKAMNIIKICDTGCGMSQEFQRHIFDMFTQERNSNSESQKGTGLGMSISYLLVEQMGGKIEVESELGEGTCFTVMLSIPIDGSHAAETPGKATAAIAFEAADTEEARASEASSEERARSSSGEPLRLLVAEDNDLNADIISSILSDEGYEVVVVSNGKEAVEAFASASEGYFAAVLMDAQMPVMDGYEAARQIREMDRGDARTVKIFACTASTFAEDRAQAMEAGMDDFLPKPLNVPLMLGKLDEIRRDMR